ncbi:hypothetical protein KAR91_79325 [Candidatus Pacearchaeota archaeon]|nr:hypothetical protein [Candidatus Pacearchaeota archaeon]
MHKSIIPQKMSVAAFAATAKFPNPNHFPLQWGQIKSLLTMIDIKIRALAYLGFGVTGEVIFTAIKALIHKKEWSLQGYTQVWVMPLYALGGVYLFEPLHLIIQHWHILIRFSVYALFIFGLEYLMGFFAKQLIGKCPWEYKGKWHIHGYINLPHFPAWGAVGLLGEIVHNYLINL